MENLEKLMFGDYTLTSPKKFTLHKNVPNPFLNETLISFDLLESAHVLLIIVDEKNDLIKTLINRDYIMGSYKFKWLAMEDLSEFLSDQLFECKLIISQYIKSELTITHTLNETMFRRINQKIY